ncbi:hypothetical protein L596_002722 [Steinernema carpocapsae]|nr:hypothetical protein L596_002722 [Steinernema carpocapsae]
MKARDEYKQYIEKHAKVRENFEEKMVKAAKAFQAHDEAHLLQVRNFFTHLARSIEDGYSAAAQVAAQYRESMQVVDIEQLMNKFVEERGTGVERPESVEFEVIEIAADLPASIISSSNSAPSSSNSSAIVPSIAPAATPSASDLLSLDTTWTPTARVTSDSVSTLGGIGTNSVVDLSMAAPVRTAIEIPKWQRQRLTTIPSRRRLSSRVPLDDRSFRCGFLSEIRSPSQTSQSTRRRSTSPSPIMNRHSPEIGHAMSRTPVGDSDIMANSASTPLLSVDGAAFSANLNVSGKGLSLAKGLNLQCASEIDVGSMSKVSSSQCIASEITKSDSVAAPPKTNGPQDSLSVNSDPVCASIEAMLVQRGNQPALHSEDAQNDEVGKKTEAPKMQTMNAPSFTRTQSSSSLLKTVLEGAIIKKTQLPSPCLTRNSSDLSTKSQPAMRNRPPKLSERNLSLIETFRRIDKLCAPEVERVRRSRATCKSCSAHALTRRRVESAPESFMKKTYDRFLKKRNRKSKKSTNELNMAPEIAKDRLQFDDTKSVASSSKSDDKAASLFGNSFDASGFVGNGPTHLMDLPIESTPSGNLKQAFEKDFGAKSAEPHVDEEGYTIREDASCQADAKTNTWSTDSSEDESDLQASKIRQLNIKPLNESTSKMNASVDELRSAIGSIHLQSTLNRSSTFDADPWSSTAAPFSQSLNAPLRSIRPSLTGDEHLRRKHTDSDFGSASQLPFAQTTIGAGISRARPRSNTPTFSASAIGLNFSNSIVPLSNNALPGFCGPRRASNTDNSAFDRSDSVSYLGPSSHTFESPFSVSQSNLLKSAATINEQRVPIGVAQKEFFHTWFKGADFTNSTMKVVGNVIVSFPSSVIDLLTDIHSDVEPLKFALKNATKIKAITPNKQLVPPTPMTTPSEAHKFTVDRLGLANWLIEQRKNSPSASFHNVDIIRYEVDVPSAPPLYFTSYWKLETTHTDLRVDYRLNTDDNGLDATLLNVTFTTKVSGNVTSVTSEPSAKWSEKDRTLSWSLTEITRHGDSSGSLKARVHLQSGPSEPEKTFVQFETNDTSISGSNTHLESDDTYHLSLSRRKVVSGKFFCDPEVRK